MKKPILVTLIAALIILLFLYASLSKILSFHQFVGEINNQPLPNSWTPFLSVAIPAAEVLISVLVAFERTRLAGFWLSLFFMSVFTVYAIVILLHGFSYIPCSCGGVIEHLTWPEHLLLNISYVVLSGLGIRLQRQILRVGIKHP